MWEVNGKPIDLHWLEVEPVRVLYDYDGPRIYICEDRQGSLHLAYQCGEDRATMRFLVVPFTYNLEDQLKTGQISLREALSRRRAWIFDLGFDWKPRAAWEVELDRVPAAVLPKPGVMLWRHLRPVIHPWTPHAKASTTVRRSWPESPGGVTPQTLRIKAAAHG